MGDLLNKLDLNENQIVKVKNIEDNLNFINNYLKLKYINIKKKKYISGQDYWAGFKSSNTNDSDRVNLIFNIIMLLNSNRRYINSLNSEEKKLLININNFFSYDTDYYEGGYELTEEVKFTKDFDYILDELIIISDENRKTIEEINTSTGGNKKTKGTDKYTVKQLKTMAFVYNVKTTKKSNGKIVNLKSEELLAKLKRSKIIL